MNADGTLTLGQALSKATGISHLNGGSEIILLFSHEETKAQRV